jgi:hypothetical protein
VLKYLTAAVIVIAPLSACHQAAQPERVEPATTIPTMDPLGSKVTFSAATFRNVTHDSISPFWGRRKADGERSWNVMNLLRGAGLNWIPAADTVSLAPMSAETRLPKRLACGPVDRASLFTGAGQSMEHDWGFLINPADASLTDTAALRRNATRVRQMPGNIDRMQAGKHFELKNWNYDAGRQNILLELEVSAPDALLNAPWNPFPCEGGRCQLKSHWYNGGDEKMTSLPRPPATLCGYGPWVQEAIHGFRPEIHPVEGLYWKTSDGSWNVLMIQDASGRFDVRQASDWFSLYRSDTLRFRAEHWLQEAMVGEFTVPLDSLPSTWNIALIGEQGLEVSGAGGFPVSTLVSGAKAVAVPDPRLQAALVGDAASGRSALVVRAQIRGASHDNWNENDGAYVLLRIGPPRSAASAGGTQRLAVPRM